MIQAIPSPPPEWAAFTIGIFTVRAFAICIVIAILVAGLVTSRRLTNRGAEPGVILDVGIWAVFFGFVGARAFHVLTHPNSYFGAGHQWWEVFAIWLGGYAIYGALLGGAIGVFFACRITGLRFWSVADALAPGLLLGQAIGRIGNWFNVELYGLPTNLPWGLQVPASNPAFPHGLASTTLFSPTFLYELVWDVVGAVLIIAIERRGRPLRWGTAAALYFIWYGLGRAWFESIRIDPTEILFGLRINVWASFISIAVGLVIFAVSVRRHPGLEPSVYRTGRQWSPRGLAVGSVYTAADFTADAATDQRTATSGSLERR